MASTAAVAATSKERSQVNVDSSHIRTGPSPTATKPTTSRIKTTPIQTAWAARMRRAPISPRRNNGTEARPTPALSTAARTVTTIRVRL